jgi:hypothetical protein
VIGVVEDVLQVEERRQLKGGTVVDERDGRQIASRGSYYNSKQQQAPLDGR